MGKSKHALAIALREICRSKELDKVSVTEIAKQANLTRQIFYHHFFDKYELARWIYIHDLICVYEDLLYQNKEIVTWREVCVQWFLAIEKDKNFYRNTFTSHFENEFMRLVFNHVMDVYQYIYKNVFKEVSEERKFELEFFSTALTIKVDEWIKLNKNTTSKQMCELIFLSMPKEMWEIFTEYKINVNDLIKLLKYYAAQSEAN